jgi:dihydrofolate synthase/folylpolyglutamate synthase
VSRDAIKQALSALRLPGRMERRGRFLLDVAHNTEAAAALAAQLQSEGRTAVWVAGLLADKPAAAMAEALHTVVDRAFCCDLPGPRGLDASALAQRLSAAGLPAQACGTPDAALRAACLQARPEQTILVAGSFLTVALLSPLIDSVD